MKNICTLKLVIEKHLEEEEGFCCNAIQIQKDYFKTWRAKNIDDFW